MAENSIGRMAVEVGVDLSDLQSGLEEAKQEAVADGQAIADAIGNISTGDLGNKIAADLAPAQDAFAAFQTQVEALVAGGSTLAEAMAAVQAPAAAVASEVASVGAAAQSAAQQLGLFEESAHIPFADEAGQLNLFTTELEDFGASAAKATESETRFSESAQGVIDRQKEVEEAIHTSAGALAEIYDAYQRGEASAGDLARAQKELADATSKVGESSKEAESGASEFLTKILEFAGITVSIEALREFATEAFNLYAAEERAGEGLAFLRGNASGAEEMLNELRGTAQDLAIPFDSVLKAAQKMAYFKLTAEETAAAITVAADASKASGASFDTLASTINNIALAGMVMPRTLKQIGVSMDDLATVMGVDASQVTKTFKEMEQAGRLDALVAAMERTRGATEAMANDTQSNLTRMKNSWDFALTDMGSAIAPLVVEAIPQIVSGFKYLASAGVIVATGLKEVIAAVVGNVSIVLEAITALGKGWYAVITGDFKGAASVASDALGNIKSAAKFTFDSIGKDAEAGLTALDKIWAEQVDTAKKASAEEIAEQAKAAAAAAKAAADRIAAAAELKKELKEVATFAKGIAPALAEAGMSESDYLTSLLVGGKSASAVMKELTADILKGETAAAGMSGAPLAAMNAWIAKLKEAQVVESNRAAMDEEAKAWTDILDKRRAYAAKVAEYAQQISDQMAADQQKADLMAEQASTAHQVRMLEIARQTTAEQAKIHSITLFDELGILQQIDAQEAVIERQALSRELAILDEKSTAEVDYASKREAILTKIQVLEDKTNGKSQVDAINAQTVAYRALGLESEKALTTQIKEADQALKILQDQGAAIGLIYAGEEKELALRIKKDELTGASATSEIIALKNIQVQQQALYDQTHLIGDLYVGVINDILKGWDQIGKSIADNIIDEQNWGKMFINVGKQIGKMILEDLVGTYMKALKNAILGVNSDTLNLGKSFEKLGSTISKVLGGSKSPTDINGNALPSAQPVDEGDAAPTAGGGATGAASGILGSLGSVASLVGVIANLINGIVQDFQLAHISKKMGEVEINTRGALNQLINLQMSANEYWPGIKDIHDYLWFTQGTWLIQIETDLFEILGIAQNMFLVLGLIAESVGNTGALGTGTPGSGSGSSGSATSVAQQLQDILNAIHLASVAGSAIGDHQSAVLSQTQANTSSINNYTSSINDYTGSSLAVMSDGFTDVSTAVTDAGNTVAGTVAATAFTTNTLLATGAAQIADALATTPNTPSQFVTGSVLFDSTALNGVTAALQQAAAQGSVAAPGGFAVTQLTPATSITTPNTDGMSRYNASVASGATPLASQGSLRLEVKVDTPDENKIADKVVGALEARGFKF